MTESYRKTFARNIADVYLMSCMAESDRTFAILSNGRIKVLKAWIDSQRCKDKDARDILENFMKFVKTNNLSPLEMQVYEIEEILANEYGPTGDLYLYSFEVYQDATKPVW